MNGTAITNRLQIAFKMKDYNLYRSSYYWNFRTSSFKQVPCLILIDFQFKPIFITNFFKSIFTLYLFCFVHISYHSSRKKITRFINIVVLNVSDSSIVKGSFSDPNADLCQYMYKGNLIAIDLFDSFFCVIYIFFDQKQICTA
jgi:hypothetical protein